MAFPKRRLDQQRWQRGKQPRSGAARTAWDEQAAWYEGRHGAEGDDFHQKLILPAVLAALGPLSSESATVLDVGCGTGVVSRALAAAGWRVHGIDASPQQLRYAEERSGDLETYQCADVTADPSLPDDIAASVQHAVAVLSLQDIESLAGAVAFLAAKVPVGGQAIVVLTHPCFRVPKHATWGWDEERQLQYRRVDSYMSVRMLPIRTNPGQGGESVMSKSFHRPFHVYANEFGAAGFGIVGSQELCSHRRGTQGSRASAEDRACREIPVFLQLQLRRLAVG